MPGGRLAAACLAGRRRGSKECTTAVVAAEAGITILVAREEGLDAGAGDGPALVAASAGDGRLLDRAMSRADARAGRACKQGTQAISVAT